LYEEYGWFEISSFKLFDGARLKVAMGKQILE
jgi:hypothetical protein